MCAGRWSDHELAPFRETYRSRARAEHSRLSVRRTRTLALAKEAARILRARYGAGRVMLVGSLAGPEDLFTQWSDVDLLAWGVPACDTFRAVAELAYMDPELPVELICAETCAPDVLDRLLEQAVEL